MLAKGDHAGAQRQLQIAVARGYRAARVDLADVMLKDADGIAREAQFLYEQAWRDGVSIAAFKLGNSYEVELHAAAGAANSYSAKARQWYERGAAVGEPNALGRLGRSAEQDALAETDRLKSNNFLLQALSYYAEAAERARVEGWPDETWRGWRRRRASLARVLAAEGMMQQAAATRGAVESQRSRD